MEVALPQLLMNTLCFAGSSSCAGLNREERDMSCPCHVRERTWDTINHPTLCSFPHWHLFPELGLSGQVINMDIFRSITQWWPEHVGKPRQRSGPYPLYVTQSEKEMTYLIIHDVQARGAA